MKNVLKRIIVGIIIGLVLMCCRKYLFINASAATRVSPIMDNYRFTYNNDTFKQSAFNGQNADLPDSTLGATNSGSLQYYFHTNGNVEVKKGNILYFTIGTSISNSSTTYVNSTFSMGNVGYITTGLDSHYFPCEVSTIIADNDTSFYYTARDYYGAGQGRSFYTDAIQTDLRIVTSYKCTFDEDTTLLASPNNNIKIASPNMSYSYGTWSFYSRGISFILITNNIESMILDSQQASTTAIEETNDILSDSTTDDPSSDISDMQDEIATNGTISQLLTLPIQLYQNILNSVSGSCSSFNLGNLLGTNLLLPCINLQNLLGSTLYGVIDVLCSGIFILGFRKKMVDIFNHMTSLDDRGNELE